MNQSKNHGPLRSIQKPTAETSTKGYFEEDMNEWIASFVSFRKKKNLKENRNQTIMLEEGTGNEEKDLSEGVVSVSVIT